jgi:hypothetical protein
MKRASVITATASRSLDFTTRAPVAEDRIGMGFSWQRFLR